MMHWQAWYSEVKTFSGKDLSHFHVPKVLEGQHLSGIYKNSQNVGLN